MPNYTTEFSEELSEITLEERRWLEERLAQLEAEAGDMPFQHTFEQEGNGSVTFWFHSDEELPETLLDLLQEFFKEFRPTQYLVIGFALTCSRSIPGEFGGGRIFIAADRIIGCELDAWEREQVAQFQQTLAEGRS